MQNDIVAGLGLTEKYKAKKGNRQTESLQSTSQSASSK